MDKKNQSYASLCLYGSSLDPDYISKLIGLSPSYSCREGDVFTSPSGKKRKAQTGVWLLNSEPQCCSECLAAHVQWLINRIVDSVKHITVLDGVESAHISCCFIVKDSGDAVEFDPVLLGTCSGLGLPIKLVAYPIDD